MTVLPDGRRSVLVVHYIGGGVESGDARESDLMSGRRLITTPRGLSAGRGRQGRGEEGALHS